MFYCTVHKQKGRHVSPVCCDYSEKACNGSKSGECAEKYGGREEQTGVGEGRNGKREKKVGAGWR